MAKKYFKLSQILKKLLFEKDMRPVDLARALEIPGPTIHRIVTGKSTRPNKSSLTAIAKYLDVKVDQLTGEEPLFPEHVAESHTLPAGTNAKTIPLLTWQQLTKNGHIYAATAIADSKIVVLNVSDAAFAVTAPDYAMEPLFPKGATLIFDPTREVNDRNYILVKLQHPDSYVFRQLLVDVDQRFIKPLNPEIGAASGIKTLQPEDIIVARLIEVRNQL